MDTTMLSTAGVHCLTNNHSGRKRVMGRKLGSIVFTVALVICFVGYLSIVPQVMEDGDMVLASILIILAICIATGLC